MKHTAMANAMRDVTEALGTRHTSVLRLTDPLEGYTPSDAAAKKRVDPATGMTTFESPTLAEAPRVDLKAAVREWEARIGRAVQDARPAAEVLEEAQKAGRSLDEVALEMRLASSRPPKPR
jgi:hypothetical protein